MTEERADYYRLKMAIGLLIPTVPGVAFVAWFESNYTTEVLALPQWIHWTITIVSLALTIGIIVWATRGGIPPRTRKR